MLISIIVPAHNESQNIKKLVDEVDRYLNKLDYDLSTFSLMMVAQMILSRSS